MLRLLQPPSPSDWEFVELIEQGLCLVPDQKPADAGRDWEPRELSSDEKAAHEAAVLPCRCCGVGLIGEDVYLDLDYILDSNANVDMNVIGTSDGMLVESGSREEATYSRAQMDELMDMAEIGFG